ncbi:unnamed protein product [Calypogeia fissa]
MEPGEYVTLLGVTILAVWGMQNGEFCYEGCQVPLEDGRACALGVSARRKRLKFPQTLSHPNARDRTQHTCASIGKGIPMYSFYAQIEDEVLEIWEDAGAQLFQMPGHEFVRRHWNAAQRSECCQQVMEELWMVKVWRPKDKGRGQAARVISFSKVVTKVENKGGESHAENHLTSNLTKLEVGEASSDAHEEGAL